MNRLRDYLHEHMADNPSLDELALQCGLDRFRLTRQFTRAFGQSPHAYLVRLRLRAARLLLAQGKNRRRSPCRWVLPIRAIWAAGSSAPTDYRRRPINASAQTFYTVGMPSPMMRV